MASIGGYQRQYQITVDPNRLAAYQLPIETIVNAVRRSNNEVGGRLLEFAGTEYMVRGRGYVTGVDDIERIAVGVDARSGTPILVKNVAHVAIGPDLRRGVADLDGLGDAVGGIVVMRHGENALAVIDRVKAKLAELTPTLPEGVEVVTTYDRSGLIRRSIDTLIHSLVEEMVIVSAVILLFLWHIPSAIVPIVSFPGRALACSISSLTLPSLDSAATNNAKSKTPSRPTGAKSRVASNGSFLNRLALTALALLISSSV